MEYIAHIDGERIQTVKEHLYGTAELAEKFAGQFGCPDWGYCCGLLHDIGKYSAEFQRKIKENTGERVDHSTAGAQLCLEKDGAYGFMSYCIAGHHAGLPDYGERADAPSAPTLCGRRKKKVKDYQAYKGEITIPEVHSNPIKKKSSHIDFSVSVFIRMLYSCLVDADFLDTEKFMKNGKTGRDSGESIEDLLAKLENHISGWLQNTETESINGRRTEILKACLEAGKSEQGLFRLTVPTGGGKTIASLAFALRHAAFHQMKRIIYVIPYTSIIEQNAAVFRDILGEENVLENHYNVDYKDDNEDPEIFHPMKLAAENWDKPVIVTTNVQFFESLYSNKSSRCRKLHNIANSVIIFDEVQMLPNDYLLPCIAMMEELLDNYKTSIVLCTATQPALTPFFQNYKAPVELCPRVEEQFDFFKRVSFQNIGEVGEEALIEKLKQEEQALCIVNTKKRAQSLYRQMDELGVYHLSTTMYPKHRKRVLNTIRKRLKKNERCIVIATSLVEAGVDLDFQTVYRQLAGVDSMIQAAGRCNREGKRPAEKSRVFIFSFDGKEEVPGQRQQIDVANNILSDGEDIADLNTVTDYFQMLYHVRGENLDKKKILDEFQGKRYHFAKVGKEFKLIEENTKSVFINCEEEADSLLNQIKYQGYTKMLMRKAGQYCVNIYERDYKNMEGAGMLRPVSEDIENLYELTAKDQYTEELGLGLDVGLGMALWG